MVGDIPSNAELQRKVAILTRLAETSAVLNSTQKLKTLLSNLMDTTAEIVGSESASVLLWDYKSQQLVFAATTSDSAQALIGLTVPLEGSIAGSVFSQDRTVVVNDTSLDPRHYSKVDEKTEFTTRSILGVPMRVRNRVMGVLEAVNKREAPWTDDDAHYLNILASQAAVAIEGAQLYNQLQKAHEELAQVDKLKSDFIAIASHELRTPLGVILGYASFLQDTDDPQVRTHADKMVQSAMQLRRIIEDMTNLRYLEQHTLDLTREGVELRDFLNDAVEDIRSLADAKGHRLQLLPVPSDVRVNVDRARILMALANVLNNAIRFTPDNGKITLQAEVRNRKEVWISVTDSGVGLERDQLERIFEKFVQVEDHMTRHHGGLGIGLSIARAVVDAHGGRIWASSPGINQGTTITITLPLA